MLAYCDSLAPARCNKDFGCLPHEGGGGIISSRSQIDTATRVNGANFLLALALAAAIFRQV